jgi:uncharacterized protein
LYLVKGGITMTIKRITQLLVSMFAILLVLVGCTTEKTETTKPKEATTEQKEQASTSTIKPFLYEVKKGDATVYLFGTQHLGKESYYPLPTYAEEAFKNSDALVTEIKMDEIPIPDLSKFVYKNGETIENHLSEKAIEHLKKIVPEYGIDYEKAKLMNPGMLGITLTQLTLGSTDYSPNYGLDTYFTKKAKETNKELLALETVQFQLDLLYNNQFTKEEAEQAVLAIKPKAESVDEFKQMATYFEQGDVEKLEKYVIESTPEKEYKSIIYDRNVNMTNKIEEYFKTNKTYFVAVGAAHVIGKDGIVAMLQQKGYSPTRIEK